MMYDKNKYADMGVICHFLGSDICEYLPALHTLTGCDTTSNLFNVGKATVFHKTRENQTISNVGKNKVVDQETIENTKEFIRTDFYTGTKSENYENYAHVTLKISLRV